MAAQGSRHCARYKSLIGRRRVADALSFSGRPSSSARLPPASVISSPGSWTSPARSMRQVPRGAPLPRDGAAGTATASAAGLLFTSSSFAYYQLCRRAAGEQAAASPRRFRACASAAAMLDSSRATCALMMRRALETSFRMTRRRLGARQARRLAMPHNAAERSPDASTYRRERCLRRSFRVIVASARPAPSFRVTGFARCFFLPPVAALRAPPRLDEAPHRISFSQAQHFDLSLAVTSRQHTFRRTAPLASHDFKMS